MAFRAAVALALLAVAGLAAGQGEVEADCFALCPRLPPAAAQQAEILHNPGFTVGYSEQHRAPLWAAYKAKALPRRGKPSYRRALFAADTRLADPVKPFEYRGSGYDRGHLAPAFLLTVLHGAAAGAATYLMSNVTPQRPAFNRLLWERLEEAEAHKLAREPGGLWVLVGPIFSNPLARTESGVAIPEAFFRIWLVRDARGGKPRACAFIVPQSVRGDEPLTAFASTVDAVEPRTGLDFYSALSHHEQALLEAVPPSARWPLAAIADWPARYALGR